MSYRAILQILLLLVIISTVCICVMKPQMHKSVMVYNSDYIVTPKPEVTVEEKNIPVLVQEPEVKQVKTNVVNNIEVQTYQQPVSQTVQVTQTKQPVKNVVTQTKSAPVRVVTPTTTKQETNNYQQLIDRVKNNATNQITTQNVQTTTQPVVQQTVTTPKVTTQPKISTTVVTPSATTQNTQTTTKPKIRQLTAAEEEIAWNKWRSNLTNQIMRDVRLPNLPNGTVFRFTFDVDKYGKVSNVQTWSDNSTYTPYAIQYVAPVIRSYQGKSILNFPEGSNRVSTQAKGAWKISSTAKLSSPSDYNDIEKITK